VNIKNYLGICAFLPLHIILPYLLTYICVRIYII
jgi:hypothetical protein